MLLQEKAIAFGEALSDEFMHYILQVKKNADAMAKAFVKRGYDLISGGTDNHMMLIDLRNKKHYWKRCRKMHLLKRILRSIKIWYRLIHKALL